MAQFNIVKGDSSRISTDITPFQEGRFYLTNDGGLYVDAVVNGENKRIHLNPTTGVTTFKGRTGAVTPQSGDYTAGMVGAMPTSGGTFTGAAYAANDTAYTTYKIRNAAIVSSVPSSMANGTIAFVYS